MLKTVVRVVRVACTGASLTAGVVIGVSVGSSLAMGTVAKVCVGYIVGAKVAKTCMKASNIAIDVVSSQTSESLISKTA